MQSDHDKLEPIDPGTAQELHLKHNASECATKTVQSHKYRLNPLVRWCDDTGLNNLNHLAGRNLQEYRHWRQEDGDLNQLTLNQQMSTLRVFLQWCASIEAVPPNLYEKVMIPRVRPENQRRDETLSSDTAQTILDHLTKFHYASIEHTVLAVLWETGILLDGASSVDVENVDLRAETIELVHRPEEGTRLKNGPGGERPIAITKESAGLLDDYLSNTRTETTDEFDRAPLFTTTRGRMHRGTLRSVVYRRTAPRYRSEPCPDCTGTEDRKCPEAVSPRAVRRGGITHFLSEDVPVSNTNK